MERINIAELLKNCPKNMELNCLMYEDVYFDYVDELNIIHCHILHTTYTSSLTFNQHGTPNSDIKSKCVIFPKGKTTWEGFVPPCEFKDGDVLVHTQNERFIMSIYKSNENEKLINTHVIFWDREEGLSVGMQICCYTDNVRFATKEEKAKLFQAIKDNGYKWNPETKTLEKLSKFKEGDVAISDLGDIHLLRTKDSSYCAYRIRWTGLSKLDNTITTGVKVARLATEEEKQILFDSIKANGYRWNEETKSLEKLINKNKFVIGAIVTNGKIKGRICLRDGDSYVLEDGTHIFFNEVHNWELVSNKFDINTLKPFDKVLVRHNIDDKWCSSFFSHIDSDFHSNCYKYVTVAGKSYPMCIPYEGNEHLSSSTNNCIEYYKTW